MIARRAVFALAAVAAFLVTGCTVVPTGGPRISVSRFGDGAADPVAISVSGLRSGESVVLSATATTAVGSWSSRAVYAVPPDGRVELWTQQPVAAPYARPDAGALLWAMSGPSVSQGELERTWARGGVGVRITAQQEGRRVAAADLYRDPLGARSVERVIVSDDILGPGGAGGTPGGTKAGTLYYPLPTLLHPRPAVIVIDGDAGGASGAFAAPRIAALGFPVFVLPAFGPEGQIPGSAALSVDSFDAVRTWLAGRPGVDPHRIVVWGTGRAAPLALWLAAEKPGDVYSAIAAAGRTALLCTSSAGTPALYVHGQPVPCADPGRSVADTPILPLATIPGPVLLACGTADQLLPSACEWMRAGQTARGAHSVDEVLAVPGAAHDIATPPMLPIGLDTLPSATAQDTENGRAEFWARVTELLEGIVEP